MLVAQKVNQFVTKHRPKAVCDGCIVKGLSLTAHAHSAQITAALGTGLTPNGDPRVVRDSARVMRPVGRAGA